MYVEPSGCLLEQLEITFAGIEIDNQNLDRLMLEAQIREHDVIGIDNQIQTAISSTVQKMYTADVTSNDKLDKEASEQANLLKKKKVTELALEEMEEIQMIADKAKQALREQKQKIKAQQI